MPDAAPSAGDRAAQLELLVDSVEDYAVFMLDPGGHVATWNRGAQRIKGYRAQDIIGSHFSRFYTDEDRERDHPAHELEIAIREGRYEEEGWRVRKDGSRFWANVVITAVRYPDGRLAGFGKVTRDLTARRLAEEQLRRTAAELRAANRQLAQFERLVKGVRDYAIFLLDAGGHVVSWNAGAEHIKGYRPEEIIGRHFSVFYTQEDRDREHPAHELEIAAREGRHQEEGWRVRKDGTLIWASVTITAVRDAQGVLTGFSKVTRDLSERRRADDRLRAAQDDLRRTNEELERFAVVAAHDLREPLTTVGSYVQLVRETEEEALGERARAALDEAAGAVLTMQHLIEELLTFARLGGTDVEVEPVVLRAATERVLARLDASVRRTGARVEVDVPADAVVSVVRLGADLLLQNLVANALKFGAPGGPRVEVSARAVDGGWELSVTDDGRGLAPEDQARVFEPFERVRSAQAPPGQGLGLSICRRVAERSGGRLGVESALGEGSRFWCWLPAAG